jgi:hypothetical protein
MFTPAELVEMRRALHLISQEDSACNVRMDVHNVKAKASALAKLNAITNWRDPLAGPFESIDVTKVGKK